MISLEDTALTSYFHAFPKRCVIAASHGPRFNVALSAYNVIYVFKLVGNHLELRAKLQCECEPQIAISTRRRKAAATIEPAPGDSTQVAMQKLATIHAAPRFVHVSWTPKIQLAGQGNVNLLCTISVTNRIELWHVPNTSPPGHILYIENVLNVGSLILKQCGESQVPLYPNNNDFKDTLANHLARCMYDSVFPVAHFLEAPNDINKSLIGLFAIGDFIAVVRIGSEVAEDYTERAHLFEENVGNDDEEEMPSAIKSGSELRYIQGQDHILDLKGANILNGKGKSDLFMFDYSQCSGLFPIETTKGKTNQISGFLMGIAHIGQCCSIVGVSIGSNTLIYVSKLDCSVQVIKATITFDKPSNPRLVWGKVTIVDTLTSPLEMMRHYKLDNLDIVIGISLGSIRVFQVNGADAHGATAIRVSNAPLVSYSLKTCFEYEENNLAEITAVDQGGLVYKVLLDSHLKLVQLPGEIERSCGLVAQCDAGPSLYSCKTWTNHIGLQHAPIHSSLFVNVLAALGMDAEWRLDFIHQHIYHFKTQRHTTNGHIDVEKVETTPLEHENMQKQADHLINSAKYPLLVDVDTRLKKRVQDANLARVLALSIYSIACIEATRQTDAARQLALVQVKVNSKALNKFMYTQLDKLGQSGADATNLVKALKQIILDWLR